MNFYPSWIHRIPEMLEALALLPDERIDRRRAEELFDLRRSAAHELLRRLGAERCGNALAISRSTLIARLREAQEHPDWRWERERRQAIRNRIETLRPAPRKSQVPVTPELQNQMDTLASTGLPASIQFSPGQFTVACRDMEHLVEQLVLVAQALDSEYESLQGLVERPARKKPQPDGGDYAAARCLVNKDGGQRAHFRR
jgi:hypothetical protein